jgi:hypothetical protein
MDEPDLEPGSVFGGYQVLQLIGAGGMGRVYRARHRTLERDVALKVMAPRVLTNPGFVDRFMREARAAARLNHPSIVQIYDIGQEDGRYYLVLEYVEGCSLGSLLRERGAFPVVEAVALARQAALALAVAHEAGIVHRDVKPDNMLLTARGELKLVDLGLAKRVDIATDFATETGAFTGTPHYMAPEQIRGVRDVDGRADIYALGATLFHMVCGRTPCGDGWGGAVLAAHLEGRIEDPATVSPGLPPELCGVIRRMMARDREHRHASARDVERDLARVATLYGGEQSTLALDLATVAVRPPPGPPVSLDALEQLEELLVSDLGPVARVLLRQMAHDSGDGFELCQRLAGHYTEPALREGFLARSRALVAAASNPGPVAGPPPVHGPVSTPPAHGPVAGHAAHGPVSAPPAHRGPFGATPVPAGSLPFAVTPISAPGPGPAFDTRDLQDLERDLAETVGPIARVLVGRAAARAASWPGLVATLAEQVPEGEERRRFAERHRSHPPRTGQRPGPG